MDTTRFSRRELLKGGALVISFSILAPLSKALGQATAHIDPYGNPDYLDPRQLDSWVAVTDAGVVIVSTGKVDLGTGIETALAQIAADELDVPFNRIHMQMGHTAKTVDEGRTAGSNTIQAAGQHLRQATAAARVELLKMAVDAARCSCRPIDCHRWRRQRHEQARRRT
jgi:Aerobic-type carbon monoxide dehydrogenase, large subunit CoxL/CutL homologs